MRIVPRVPFLIINSVQNAAKFIRARPQQTVESEAELRGLNFASVSRAHGSNRIGPDHTRLQEAETPVKLNPLQMIQRRIDSQIIHRARRKIALIAQIVNRKNAL